MKVNIVFYQNMFLLADLFLLLKKMFCGTTIGFLQSPILESVTFSNTEMPRCVYC